MMTGELSNGRRARAALAPALDPASSAKAVDWRRLPGYLRPYWRRMALAILALLVSSGAGLAFPLLLVRLLDSVTKTRNLGLLNSLALILVGVFLVQAAFSALQSYLLSYVGEHIVYDLRTSLYDQLQRLSLDFYSRRRVGDVVSRLTSDVTQMRAMLTTNLTSLLSQVLTLIGAIAIVLTMNAGADKSRERSKEGSGLGLGIAKKIVELHQGTIDLESQPGAGTTFRNSLPSEGCQPATLGGRPF